MSLDIDNKAQKNDALWTVRSKNFQGTMRRRTHMVSVNQAFVSGKLPSVETRSRLACHTILMPMSQSMQ
jgi:hypothetical protein